MAGEREKGARSRGEQRQQSASIFAYLGGYIIYSRTNSRRRICRAAPPNSTWRPSAKRGRRRRRPPRPSRAPRRPRTTRTSRPPRTWCALAGAERRTRSRAERERERNVSRFLYWSGGSGALSAATRGRGGRREGARRGLLRGRLPPRHAGRRVRRQVRGAAAASQTTVFRSLRWRLRVVVDWCLGEDDLCVCWKGT